MKIGIWKFAFDETRLSDSSLTTGEKSQTGVDASQTHWSIPEKTSLPRGKRVAYKIPSKNPFPPDCGGIDAKYVSLRDSSPAGEGCGLCWNRCCLHCALSSEDGTSLSKISSISMGPSCPRDRPEPPPIIWPKSGPAEFSNAPKSIPPPAEEPPMTCPNIFCIDDADGAGDLVEGFEGLAGKLGPPEPPTFSCALRFFRPPPSPITGLPAFFGADASGRSSPPFSALSIGISVC